MRTATLFDNTPPSRGTSTNGVGPEADLWSRRMPGSDAADQASTALSRDQLYDHIITINPSAGRAFLEQFDDRKLGEYLDRLQISSRPRGRDSIWVRRTPDRAVNSTAWRD